MIMSLLEEDLGNSLTANQVAKYLKTSSVTVRNNYESLGGIRLGSRYIFFEKSIINAILHRRKKTLDGAGNTSEEKVPQRFLDETGSETMGNTRKRKAKKKSYIKDNHNLID